MTYMPDDYHRGTVAAYYLSLLIQFGPAALLRHLPKIKKLVWTKVGLGILENHKLKKEKQEWTA